MLIQTDLYSFSYKKGSIIPWCKRCGTQNFYKDGITSKGKQLYRCKCCGFRFVWSSDLPRRNFFSNIISFAVEMYTIAGISLRTLAKKLKKFFNVIVSHETIRQWVKTEKTQNNHQKLDEGTTWHVDETYVKIKGKGHWLWVVYCKDTKTVLAWHISKGRFFKDALYVFKEARKAAGTKPGKVVSDGLWQYPPAVRRSMQWHWRTSRRKHLVDSGVGKNAAIEQVNREIKRRIKWFTSFQSLEGAKAFFKMWFYHFNQKSSFPTQGS